MKLRSSRAVALALVTLATFTDLIAYSICVPVLPDFAHRLGASPTMIGLLFASFGVTLLAVSVPMGVLSDRMGRRSLLVGGMIALAAATAVFAHADSLVWLFAARMIQGAADGVTWVVGFALVADLYRPAERGRVMGYVMSGSSLGMMAGPSIGGWLYQLGGLRLPFAFVSALSLMCAIGFLFVRAQPAARRGAGVSMWSVLRVPAVTLCAATVVAAGATVAMLDPVLPLFFNKRLGLMPAQIGVLFGVAAIAWTVMPFVFGPMTDRWGGRRMTLMGLLMTALWLPVMAFAWSFESALALMVVQWVAISLVVTPSLAYMAEVTAFTGGNAYGIGYGIYNTAWGVGLLAGPAAGGWLFERLGFASLSAAWSLAAMIGTVTIWKLQSRVGLNPDATARIG